MSLRSFFKGASPAYTVNSSRGGAGQSLQAPAAAASSATWSYGGTNAVPVAITITGTASVNVNALLWQTGAHRVLDGNVEKQYAVEIPHFKLGSLTNGGGQLTATVTGSTAPSTGVSAAAACSSPDPTPTAHSPYTAYLAGTALVLTYGALAGGATNASFPPLTIMWWAA